MVANMQIQLADSSNSTACRNHVLLSQSDKGVCSSEPCDDQNNKRKRFSDEQLSALTDLAEEANWSLLSVAKEVREQFCSKYEISKVGTGNLCCAHPNSACHANTISVKCCLPVFPVLLGMTSHSATCSYVRHTCTKAAGCLLNTLWFSMPVR